MKKQNLFALVQRFLLVDLKATRGLSENTIKSYRDTLRLFFLFMAKSLRKKTSRLDLDDFNPDLLLKFLESTESQRGNCVTTRNHRLALLRVFFTSLLIHDPERAGTYEKILMIAKKRPKTKMMGYLEVNEIRAILNSINQTKRLGLRDYTLLLLMYNSGGRVQEICDVAYNHLALDNSPRVTLTGKGQKTRIVPLWKKTKIALDKYFESVPQSKTTKTIFFNYRGDPITRHGVLDLVHRRVKVAAINCASLRKKRVSPHTFRHTTAMHLLQSDVDLNIIRAWLGHSSLETVHRYIEIDLKMKQEALSKKKPPQLKKEISHILKKNRDIVEWLKEVA